VLHEQGIYDELQTFYDLDKISKDKQQLITMLNDVEIPDNYVLQETPIGLYSLNITKHGVVIPMCSSYEPYEEASVIAWQIYTKMHRQNEYGMKDVIIVGLGLGYVVDILSRYKDVAHITVLETDKNILAVTLKYIGLECFNDDRVEVIYDPELSEFGKRLENADENVYIYHPAVENIDTGAVKEAVKNYFLAVTAVNNHLPAMICNFNKNILLHDETLYDIKERFTGKHICIVAGGPSLEETVCALRLIKEKYKEKACVIAVGTVAKKLQLLNIIPDYVVITDSREVVQRQLEGVDTTKCALLYMSTVESNVPALWQGKRYIIFQQGFDIAKKYVENTYKETCDDECHWYVATGGSVTTAAFDIALRFSAKTIVLFGADFAYYKQMSHTTGTIDYRNVDEQWYEMYVPSNVGGNVPTCRNLNTYRLWVEDRIKSRNEAEKQIRLINCSKGAVIYGMEYVEAEEVLSAHI
jgi:hypothetical protein